MKGNSVNQEVILTLYYNNIIHFLMVYAILIHSLFIHLPFFLLIAEKGFNLYDTY